MGFTTKKVNELLLDIKYWLSEREGSERIGVGIPSAARQIAKNRGLDKPSRSNKSSGGDCYYVRGPICGKSSKITWVASWPLLTKAAVDKIANETPANPKSECGSGEECKLAKPAPRRPSGGSGGICVGGSIGVWVWSGSFTACYMEDDHGSGFTATGESSTGIAGGPVKGTMGSQMGLTLGVGPTWSTGTVRDQKGAFDTQNYGAGYVASGTFSHGSGTTLEGKPEVTNTVLVGPGDGVTLTGGQSNTGVWYWPNN